MSNKWTWVFAILTAASFALALVFFVATQEVTGRDWVVLGIGALLGATAAALIGTFIFHSSGRAKKLAADTALTEKRTALLQALPTRGERLNKLEDNVAELRMRIEEADGHFKAGEAQALDAAKHGFSDMVFERQSNAATWKLEKEHSETQLRAAEAEIEGLKMVSDDEFLEEQKRLRGLD